MLAVHAAFEPLAEQEHRSGRAVIGAQAAILFHPPSKFREYHHGHIVCTSDAFHVFHEPAHAVCQYIQEPAMEVCLLHVRIERVAGIRDVVQTRPHSSSDERRDPLQIAANPPPIP